MGFRRLFLPFVLLIIGASCQAAVAIGEVTLVIGLVNAIRPDGSITVVRRGQLIHEGDQLETTAGGHAHIQFTDGAMLSIRPVSRLVIDQYEQVSGDTGGIKYRVERGVVRSVTGDWGGANPEKFRLNTPVAAIGVRGTDFVVKVASDSTQAMVFTGAITMAQLSGKCIETLGPCDSQSALTLAADMKGLMLELAPRKKNVPVLVQAVDLLALGVSGRSALAAPEGARQGDSSHANVDAANAADEILKPRPMAWFHNRAGWNVPSQTISARFDEALAFGMRPVAGNLFITLYRDETFGKTYKPSATGQIAFSLKDASAVYEPGAATGRVTEIAEISGATLVVDFTKSSYATHLDLASSYAGKTVLNMSGEIDLTGRFVNRNVNTSVAGAVSMDGKEVGYMFNQAIGLGNLSGMTLWGR